MGNPKQKWTQEEEQALRDGVAKYGAGKWKCIHNDPAFALVLHSRSNIDLKDKWRNLSAAAQGLTTRSRPARPKAPEDSPAAPVPPVNTQSPASVPVVLQPAANHVKEEPVKDTPPDGKVSSRGTDMIGIVLEALGGVNLESGLDIGAIISYIEEKVTVEIPQSFRKQLGAKLRKLVQQEKLEKVDNCYRLKNASLVEINANNCKDIRLRQSLIPAHARVSESLQEAAKTAAYKVAEAEEKTYMAALSVKDAERLAKMQEESDAILQLAQEIYDKWHSNEVLIA